LGKAFQFRDIRAESTSEIVDITAASALLGNTEKALTERIYPRIGQAVSPTRWAELRNSVPQPAQKSAPNRRMHHSNPNP